MPCILFCCYAIIHFGGSITAIKKIGDWSSGMTEVSKTFSGSSILSSPVCLEF